MFLGSLKEKSRGLLRAPFLGKGGGLIELLEGVKYTVIALLSFLEKKNKQMS